jgi:hypothetical protein
MTPLEALKKFSREHKAFISARIYLNDMHIGALSGLATIRESHESFATTIQPDYATPHDYMVARLFISHIAAFELFTQDIVEYVIRKYPKKIGTITFALSDILDTENTDELIQRAIEEYLNKLMYKKPLEYLNDICGLLSISEAPLLEGWKVFIEAKARRDIGIHNGWVCNRIYLRKLLEAKIQSAAQLGQNIFPTEKKYITDTPDKIYDLAVTIVELVLEKYPAE